MDARSRPALSLRPVGLGGERRDFLSLQGGKGKIGLTYFFYIVHLSAPSVPKTARADWEDVFDFQC